MTPHLTQLPEFKENVHFRRKGTGKWKWVLLNDVTIYFDTPITKRKECFRCVDTGKVWMEIQPHSVRIMMGYAWNGCSFSPDLAMTMLPSVFHDGFFQFSGCAEWPDYLDLKFANDLFSELCDTSGKKCVRFTKILTRCFYDIGLDLGSWPLWGKNPPLGTVVNRVHLIDIK